MEIRALRPSDDRKGFACGDENLDRFFRHFAGQNQFRHHVGVTWVALDGVQVLGFATVAAGQLETDKLPEAARRGMPRYPLPVLRLARLATSLNSKGRGGGDSLLKFVCSLAIRMSDELGCVGILVDAKPPSVSFYAKYGFAEIQCEKGGSAERPEPILMFLALESVRATLIRNKQ